MEDYKREIDDYFARFTFGQFITLLLIQIVALFFVFYLGAHYGPELIGSRANVAHHETDGGPLAPEKTRSVDEIVGKGKVDYSYPDVLTSKDANSKAVKIKPSGMTADEYEKKVQEVPVDVPIKKNEEVIGEATAPDQELPTVASAKDKVEDKDVGDVVSEKKPPEKKPEEKKAPEEKNAEESPKVEETVKQRYSVQVGSYQSLEEAEAAVGQWKKKGYSAFYQEGEIPDKGTWYRVRIGGFDAKPEAQAFLEKLQKREKVSALVVLSKS